MKILLVHSRFHAGNTYFPPIGLLSIATVIKNAGHEVRVLDGVLEDFNLPEIKSFAADIVGFSFVTTYYQTTKNAIDVIRPILPEALFCAGGVHPTALPEKTLRAMELDFVIIGEGEETILALIDRCLDGKKGQEIYKGIKGVAYLDHNNTFVKEALRPLQDMTKLPIPQREFLDFEKYITFPGTIKGKPLLRSASLIVSRGCPYDCIFCGNKIMWRSKLRFRTPEQAIEEVNYLHNTYGIKGFYFVDNLFTGNKKWILKLCDLMQELPFEIYWECNARVDTITDELIAKMKKAGCVQMDFGLESGSNEVLRILKKKTCLEKAEEAFKILNKHGVRTAATFIIGTPGETLNQMKKTFRFAKRINPDNVCFNFVTPYPGTELYDDAIKNQWIAKDIKFDEAWVSRLASRPVLAAEYPAETLSKLRRKFHRGFFLRNYINLPNIYLGFVLLQTIIKTPLKFIKITVYFVKTQNLNKLFDDVVCLHRANRNSG